MEMAFVAAVQDSVPVRKGYFSIVDKHWPFSLNSPLRVFRSD